MRHLIEDIAREYFNRFEGEPLFIQAPGRVNLIGEHTDYNEGFVLPAATDKGIYLAMSPNGTDQGRFYALDKDEFYETDISDILAKSEKRWPNYLLGVVDQLLKHDYECGGFDCVFGGDVPIGAGMSSSAALEGGVLYGLNKMFGWNISPKKMAQIAQKAENIFVGVQCGIMDQFTSLNGKINHALKLDCRSLEYDYIPFQRSDINIVLCDTGIRRELASSEYNVRRLQCEEGVAVIKKDYPRVKTLRDLNLNLLKQYKGRIDPLIFKRCKYVVEENNRVLKACRDLEKNDYQSFGDRMFQSHEGLQNLYEVSCEELDNLVDIARNIKGLIGARMMGGGFGGCTINLVEEEYLEIFESQIKSLYDKQYDQKLKVYKTKVSGGTQLLQVPEIDSAK